MTALTDVVDILSGIGVDPQSLLYETHLTSEPHVRIVFRTVDDLQAWCTVEKAKTEHQSRPTLQHDEYSALYDRPGRKMLVVCRVFDFEKYGRYVRGAS